MTLRARLITAFTVLVLVVIALVGALAIRSTRAVLIDQIEDRIRTASASDIFPAVEQDQGQAGRTLAVLVFNLRGEMVRSLPSGLPGRLDPLPDLATLAEQLPPLGEMFTVAAASGGSEYRAVTVRGRGGRTYVIAHTLQDVARAETALTRRLLSGGILVLAAGAGAVWLTVRRGLRPVDDMIGTAEAIAAGDLSRRIPEADPGSELGRLGASINDMLSSIEEAFAAETRANTRLKQFVADASHELRTPLAAIAGYTQLVAMGALDDPEAKERALTRIQSETSRMARLVDDLMLLARLDLADDGASRQLDFHRVDLAEVVRDALADHLAIDDDHPVEVGESGPVLVNGDPERLMQVVSNLLANLRAHTPQGTSAGIRLVEAGDGISLEYLDQGPGFLVDSLDKLFDRFHRADPSRSRSSGGSGLGLAIVAAIVRAHGGTISAGNREGAGASVVITLPR
ncbi:MAG TPA: ATP-binding protein [Acidimicrobiia bacterium]